MKTTLNISVYLLDIVMLLGAFVLGYYARLTVPLFAIPVGAPALSEYVGVIVMHIGSIMVVFYLSRLYHLPRAT
ncbi:MAG: hypothetical protein AAF653_05400, partial [Chloroflexota bacterium]